MRRCFESKAGIVEEKLPLRCPFFMFSRVYPGFCGGVPIVFNQPFGGFGGTTTGTLYRIPLFRCGELIYPEFPIIAAHIDLPCQMLLPATMFSGLIYEVDACNHKFNVTIPDHESHVRKLIIEDRNGNLHILCTGENVE